MRRSMSIRFTDYDMIEMFSRDIANLKGEFDIVSGRKVVDAKSFLGIFSLDLSAPLTLNDMRYRTAASQFIFAVVVIKSTSELSIFLIPKPDIICKKA